MRVARRTSSASTPGEHALEGGQQSGSPAMLSTTSNVEFVQKLRKCGNHRLASLRMLAPRGPHLIGCENKSSHYLTSRRRSHGGCRGTAGRLRHAAGHRASVAFAGLGRNCYGRSGAFRQPRPHGRSTRRNPLCDMLC